MYRTYQKLANTAILVAPFFMLVAGAARLAVILFVPKATE